MTIANRLATTSTGVARTRALGRRLAKLLRAGDIALLQGPLGAGKTAFAQGVGAGLKVEGQVTSPTFVLMARHDGGSLPLFHADLYRLTASEEVAELELAEQAAEGVLLVEWPELGLDALPNEHLLVAIEPVEDAPDERRITFVANGERYQRVLDGLAGRV
ncbi:MAG TPA: tRNA (adenosine(37)-N6)-threonylcarbamoyltransferase complex ATPase subunit type 1 TsaE [Dehalococcoidia bacterium]|jgi:tRNA threonylcarbamoyladenosine biosynthesis protein TsaE|nr:tRNA (adenosine(37)-N6)-threonylcarbamoyltransferase complex ATPase subunit type 1 TsaE [Dehalococcoidia bacterium]